MHEQANGGRTAFFDNLTMKESLQLTHQHSSHALTKMLANDNHILADNQSHLNNNSCLTNSDNLSVTFTEFIASSRHVGAGTSTTTATSAVVLSYSEDRINNNSAASPSSSSSPHGVGIMSHKNFMLSFDQPHQSTSSFVNGEALMSPAEVPFGRRYAEISQFKNHPNVEW
jgi:hypothetical protein